MSFGLDEREQNRRFAEYFKGLEDRLAALETTNQLTNASIEGGSLDVYTDDGTLRASFGVQEDGAVAVVTVNSDPPPTPAAPTVEPMLAGLVISWDGTWADADTAPSDFSLVQVHASTSGADFTPGLATLVATITNTGGAAVTVAVEGYTTVFARLVAVNSAQITGEASTAASGAPRQAVTSDLVNGIINDTKLAENAVKAANIALGAVNTAALADGAVLTEKLADNAVKLGKINAGAVTLNALGGALSDSAAQRYVDAMGDPAAWQINAQGTGATWNHLSGITDAPTGQTVGEARGYIRIRGTTLIPYEPGVLYRVSARVRATAQLTTGPDSFYVGVLGIGADKTTLVNRLGANSPSTHYYVASSGRLLPTTDGWVTVVGYLKDRAATGVSGSAGPNNDPRAAGLVHDAVRYITPYLWLGFNSTSIVNSPAVMQVDAVTVEALKTGLVDSTNFVAGSVTTAALATDSVTAGKVAADAISARELQANSVTANELAANSVTANAVAAGSLTAEKLTIVGSANILSDPSFEGAYTAAAAAKTTYATQDTTFGNGSPSSLKIDATSATAADRAVELTLVPVTPGDQLYLATDYFASTNWVGTEVNFQARWETAAGTILSYGKAVTTTPSKGAWGRITATVTAPAAATQARIRVESGSATAGSMWFDNAAVRPVVPGVQIADGAITTPKVLVGSLLGDRLTANTVEADRIVAASITGREIKALSIKADQLAANSVTAGKVAAGAIESTHLSVGAVTPDQLSVGSGTNLIPDPSFENAPTANIIAAGGAPWSLAPGNRTGVGIRVDCAAAAAAYYTLPLTTVPVLSAAQLWLGVDILVSGNLVAQGVKILARWETAGGTILGYGVTESTATIAEQWQRITGQVTAPQGTTQAVLCLEVSAATAGWVVFDNAEAHTVFGRAIGGARAEVGPQGLRLFDDTGQEAVSLVTGSPQYLTLRSDGSAVATIDTAGNGSFADLNVAGELTVDGDPVSTLLGDRARGLVAIDYQVTSVTGGTSELGFVELAFEAQTDRMYRIIFDAHTNPSIAGGELQLRLRDGETAKPTISSPQLHAAIHHLAINDAKRVRLEFVRSSRILGVGTHRLLITFKCQYGPDGQTVSLFGSGTSPGFFYVEDVGPHLAETGGYNDGGGTAPDPVRTYTKTYTASWSGSYARRSGYNSYYGAKCVQGYYSSTSGTQAALIGFPAALGTDLSGATIQKAEVYLYAEHWYAASGGKAVIKAHSHTARPAKFSSDSEAKTVNWSRNQGKWVDITSVFDSTKWRGIALDPNTTDRTYYGIFRGAGQTYSPKLRVTYTK
ncbi:hypothetical protein [Streptomyces sp. NBC_00620]|uniref:hypothetical protein n=1 Tax=Streptomyces sp. NBC_00620 TaxID=2903666 RepID=UPI00225584DE|nr:hypothetical protein [Streptomyces sp. NBC_00620]MCX4976431.1 hypothetical protein [Streptomyces sp. NBC_00620]